MSMPNPADRARARQDAAAEPFKDAREAMTQQDADLQAEAEGFGESHADDALSGAASTAHLEEDMAKRLAEVGDDVARAREPNQHHR